MKYRVEFEYDGMLIRARCRDINQYHEPESLRLSVSSSEGEELFPDYTTLCEIEEAALDMLFEAKFSPQV